MKKKDSELPLWARTGHRKPVTRRELLAGGVISFSTYLVLPNILNMIASSVAEGAGSCPQPGSDLIPVITVNLQGGAGLQANYVPRDQGGALLPSYSVLGLGNGSTLPITSEFGVNSFAGATSVTNGVETGLISNFITGVRETAATARAKTAFVSVCGRARDDYAENPLSIDGLVAQAGLSGTLLPSLGNKQTKTGVSQRSALLNPPAPLFVPSFAAIQNAIEHTAAIKTVLNKNERRALLGLTRKLTASQARKLSSDSSGDAARQLLECAGIKNESLVGASGSSIDPRANPKLVEIWNISGTTNLIGSSMVYNALLGNAGSVGIELGGYDYHDKTRATGDKQDLAAGRLVGRILSSAEALNKPVFVYVCTDGAVSSANSETYNSPWMSDRGSANVAYMIYFNPNGRPQTSGSQINHFTAGQVSSDSHPTGKRVDATAVTVFANYLQINNQLGLLPERARTILDLTDLSPASLARFVKFA